MHTELNIIGDVAGQFYTLLSLLQKMPKCKTVLVGDLIDRGPRSKQVVKYARENGLWVLQGNHEHMMVDFVFGRKQYDDEDVWFWNGGGQTVQSYMAGHGVRTSELTKEQIKAALFEDAEWMDELPLYHEEPGLFISHAPVPPSQREFPGDVDPFDFVWNRLACQAKWEGKFFVHGHNSRDNVKVYRDHEEDTGMNIDTSRARILTGVHWPSREIFQEKYLD